MVVVHVSKFGSCVRAHFMVLQIMRKNFYRDDVVRRVLFFTNWYECSFGYFITAIMFEKVTRVHIRIVIRFRFTATRST